MSRAPTPAQEPDVDDPQVLSHEDVESYPETEPCPWPCAHCLDWTRVWVPAHQDLDVLYSCMELLDVHLSIEPCDVHGDHVHLGDRCVQMSVCTQCENRTLVFQDEEDSDPSSAMEWDLDRGTTRIIRQATA